MIEAAPLPASLAQSKRSPACRQRIVRSRLHLAVGRPTVGNARWAAASIKPAVKQSISIDSHLRWVDAGMLFVP
jgi:hypothetical protein